MVYFAKENRLQQIYFAAEAKSVCKTKKSVSVNSTGHHLDASFL